ncbi:MAG: hypothetical protein ACR2RV_00560 [Verrucomicrobiales bacterium]
MGARSRRGFVTLDVLWIILLLAACAFLSVRGIELVDRRDKADRLKRELVAIGDAVSEAAAAEGLVAGERVSFEQYSSFLEPRAAKRLRVEGLDPFGGSYGEQIVGEEPEPDPQSIEAMGGLWK